MKKIKFLSLITGVLMLSGCQLYNPATESQLYPVQMQLKQTAMVEKIQTSSDIDRKKLSAIASHWKKTSDSPMVLQVIYNKNKSGQRTRAIKLASNYKRLLKEQGVDNIKVEMQPSTSYTGKTPELQVKYNAWKTAAPVGCEGLHMPGYYGAEMPDYALNYKMGCSSETLIGKMVARPKDLAGKEGLPAGDSRREGTVVEGYKSGTPNEPIEGMRASNMGDGG